jgi:hypothetical protein
MLYAHSVGMSGGGQCHLCSDGQHIDVFLIFFIGIVGDGFQLGPLGTAATNRPTVPAPRDYDDGEIAGMMIGRGTEILRENLPQCRFVHHKPHMLPGREPGPQRWEASD